MVKQYFTFGCGQVNKNCYHVIEAETRGACREKMFERFGTKWAFQYDTPEKAGVGEYNLREIK